MAAANDTTSGKWYLFWPATSLWLRGITLGTVINDIILGKWHHCLKRGDSLQLTCTFVEAQTLPDTIKRGRMHPGGALLARHRAALYKEL